MKLEFKKEDLFWIFLGLNVFAKGIGLGNSSRLYLLLIIIGALALLLKILFTKYNKKEFLFIIICGLIGISSFVITKKPTLLLTCMCLIGLKDIKLDQTYNFMYKIRLITFIGLISLALLGIIDNTSLQMWRNGNMDIRYSLGFGHPNTLHLSLFILIALYIYTHYDKLKIRHYLLLMAINLIIFYFSVSRTGIIVTTILILLTFLSKNFKRINKIINKLPSKIYLILMALAFLTGLLYGKLPILNTLDNIFNGRIAYTHYFLTTYNYSLFGHNISLDNNALFDNGYIFLYTQYGIIGLLFISYLIIKICNDIEKNKNSKKAVLVISFLIYIFTESFSPNIFMNIILFFIIDCIYNKGSESNEK